MSERESQVLGLAELKDEGRPNVLVEEFGLIHAIVASMSVILISELGDKTFFIAAIMAMRHSRLTVFLGAISALAVMTVMSAFFGWMVTFISSVYTNYICVILFLLFGLKMLKEAYSMPASGFNQEEFDEVHTEIKRKDEEFDQEVVTPLYNDVETGFNRSTKSNISNRLLKVVSRVFIQSFVMTFLAEWGDRSQIATIILSARESVYGVITGGIIGHSICTSIAVLGGRYAAQKISAKTVTYVGGVIFIIFAISAIIFPPSDLESEWSLF